MSHHSKGRVVANAKLAWHRAVPHQYFDKRGWLLCETGKAPALQHRQLRAYVVKINRSPWIDLGADPSYENLTEPVMSFPQKQGWLRHGVAAFSVALTLAAATPVQAAEAGTDAQAGPAATIDRLDRSLLDVMRHAVDLGYSGRYAKLAPVVSESFDIPYMTRIAVGSNWSRLTEDQQARLTRTFGDFVTATYAHRFDGYSGETFETTGTRPLGTSTLVETRLIKSDGEPVALNYVTRQDGGHWQVVDVFLTGTISELATRRSEFSAVFQRDGFDGLLATLQQKTGQIAAAS
jgi:phospholipid transport system substrate-binding protein